jgi:hypothetical protein
MDRIQINGDWYVREATQDGVNDPIKVIELLAIVFEDSEFYFKAEVAATAASADKWSPSNNSPFIEFIDKLVNKSKAQHADSAEWMRGIVAGNPDSWEAVNSDIALTNKPKFVQCLRELENRGWI